MGGSSPLEKHHRKEVGGGSAVDIGNTLASDPTTELTSGEGRSGKLGEYPGGDHEIEHEKEEFIIGNAMIEEYG